MTKQLKDTHKICDIQVGQFKIEIPSWSILLLMLIAKPLFRY